MSAETKIQEVSGRKSPQKRPIRSRIGNVRFAKTGWWCAQSHANRSRPASPTCYSPAPVIPCYLRFFRDKESCLLLWAAARSMFLRGDLRRLLTLEDLAEASNQRKCCLLTG